MISMRTLCCWTVAAAIMILVYATKFDALAREYLASAYTIRNLLVELAAALLIVLGLPKSIAARLRIPAVVGWLAGMIALALWYAPPLLIASLHSGPVRILQALSWILGGVLLYLPLYSPAPEQRMKPFPNGIVYLFAAAVFSSLLSLFIGFTRFGLYAPYLAPADTLHILPALQGRFGLNPEMDQQTACLMMWVLSCFVWLWSVMAMFWRLYHTRDRVVVS